jgi:hypothetical protein
MGQATFGAVTIPLIGQVTVLLPAVVATKTNTFGPVINGVLYIEKNVQTAYGNSLTVKFTYTSESEGDSVIGALSELVGQQETLTLGDGRSWPYMTLMPIGEGKEVGYQTYQYDLEFEMQTA